MYICWEVVNIYFLVVYFRFISVIEAMMAKDIDDNKAIGDFGAKAILAQQSGDNLVRIITHCNTGSLATAGYGTALGVIRTLHNMKKLGKIYYVLTLFNEPLFRSYFR